MSSYCVCMYVVVHAHNVRACACVCVCVCVSMSTCTRMYVTVVMCLISKYGRYGPEYKPKGCCIRPDEG